MMEIENNKNQQMEELLIKYLVGSATDSERDLARNWINESPEHQKYFDELKVYHQLSKVVQKPSGFNKEEGWNRVKASYYKTRYLSALQEKKKLLKKKIIRFAIPAAVLVAFFTGILVSQHWSANKIQSGLTYNEIVVPLGAKSIVTLSDGTKVWLNAGSKLRYPVNFLAKSREVYLEGEAFFDVAKMKSKLFIVKTFNLNIKVYGTQFNVKSYPDENQIQTTLVKGSVAIESTTEKNTIYLKPNQTVTYYKSLPKKAENQKPVVASKNNKIDVAEKVVMIPEIDPLPITSWKDSLWIIDGEELDHLAVKLERRFNVRISFQSESLKKYRFSGTLKEETFEQVLKIIRLSAPIQYTIENNNVVFTEDHLYKKNYDKMIIKTN